MKGLTPSCLQRNSAMLDTFLLPGLAGTVDCRRGQARLLFRLEGPPQEGSCLFSLRLRSFCLSPHQSRSFLEWAATHSVPASAPDGVFILIHHKKHYRDSLLQTIQHLHMFGWRQLHCMVTLRALLDLGESISHFPDDPNMCRQHSGQLLLCCPGPYTTWTLSGILLCCQAR